MVALKGAFLDVKSGLAGDLPNLVVFQFNPSCATRGPFKVELSIRPTDGRNPQHWSAERDLPRDRFTIRFK